MRLLLGVLLLVADSSPSPPADIAATLVVSVVDQEKSADSLVAETERLGGYFLSRTPQELILRVPHAQLKEVIRLAEASGKVLDRQLQRRDLAQQLNELRTRIRSKEDLMARYQEVLRTAQLQAVVTVEREVTQRIVELEQLKGQLQRLEHLAAYAQLTVRWQFRERELPAPGKSSFPWLNRLGLQHLEQEFAR